MLKSFMLHTVTSNKKQIAF